MVYRTATNEKKIHNMYVNLLRVINFIENQIYVKSCFSKDTSKIFSFHGHVLSMCDGNVQSFLIQAMF